MIPQNVEGKEFPALSAGLPQRDDGLPFHAEKKPSRTSSANRPPAFAFAIQELTGGKKADGRKRRGVR